MSEETAAASGPPGFPPPYAVDVALSVQGHDRAGHRRTDQRWLAEVWADDATRVVVLARGRFPVLPGGGAAWLSPREAPEGQRLFLGILEGVPHFAVVAGGLAAKGLDVGEPAADDLGEGGAWLDLRQAAGAINENDAGLLVHATALAEWHQAHRHCPRCGAALEPVDGGHVLQCLGCGRQHFPRTDPAVIMLVTDGERALLGRQAVWPPRRFSTLAGFVDPGESLEDAVAREVREEVGVEVTDVTFFGDQPWPFPASLMIGFFARALTTEIEVDGAEIEAARWFTRAELRELSADGTLLLPGRTSISRALIESWHGSPLAGSW